MDNIKFKSPNGKQMLAEKLDNRSLILSEYDTKGKFYKYKCELNYHGVFSSLKAVDIIQRWMDYNNYSQSFSRLW